MKYLDLNVIEYDNEEEKQSYVVYEDDLDIAISNALKLTKLNPKLCRIFSFYNLENSINLISINEETDAFIYFTIPITNNGNIDTSKYNFKDLKFLDDNFQYCGYVYQPESIDSYYIHFFVYRNSTSETIIDLMNKHDNNIYMRKLFDEE
jgi:hypothetical protein